MAHFKVERADGYDDIFCDNLDFPGDGLVFTTNNRTTLIVAYAGGQWLTVVEEEE